MRNEQVEIGRMLRLQLFICRTITVRSICRVVKLVSVVCPGRVRYSGVQDCGVGHLPRWQGYTTSWMWRPRVRAVPLIFP